MGGNGTQLESSEVELDGDAVVREVASSTIKVGKVLGLVYLITAD